MRIIRGRYKGRQIITPKNLKVRPTTDFAKEALFNIIDNYFDIESCDVLDLYSGTGNMSFEFASRGAKSVRAVEQNISCYKFLSKTQTTLGLENLTTTKADVNKFLSTIVQKYDIIFADPFYDMEGVEKLPDKIFSLDILKEEAWFILEHSKKHDFSSHPRFDSVRNYGNVNFTIFTSY